MKKLIFAVACVCSFVACGNQNKKPQEKPETKSVYVFSNEKILPITSVKNQQKSGTCWCFTTISFIESEILRQGKGEHNLSEMYSVYHAYLAKAKSAVRRHDENQNSQGGQAHDVMNAIRNYGMVPESAYRGMPENDTMIDHRQLVKDVYGNLKKLVEAKSVPENWLDEHKKILDNYFGVPPKTFTYNDKTYTPKEFAESLINVDDYVEFTSYECYPFYEKVQLEIPDNWTNELYYNIPIDDLMRVIDTSLHKGYTIAWDGDISEKGFSHKRCIAIVPINIVDDLFSEIREEYDVDDALRQKTFDSYETTDDHLMHLVGTSRDQNGTKYYIIKNSFGTERNDCGGFINMSIPYARLKTTAIMVHKNSIPNDIAKKLGIEQN